MNTDQIWYSIYFFKTWSLKEFTIDIENLSAIISIVFLVSFSTNRKHMLDARALFWITFKHFSPKHLLLIHLLMILRLSICWDYIIHSEKAFKILSEFNSYQDKLHGMHSKIHFPLYPLMNSAVRFVGTYPLDCNSSVC